MYKSYEIKNKLTYDNSAIKLMILCVIVYAFSYIGRKSYDSSINEIMTYYGLTDKADAGLVGTFFFVVYAVGQVFHGLLCKHYNQKYSVFLALVVCGLSNLAVGSMPIWGFKFLKYIWLVNGFATASLWSSLILLLNKLMTAKRLRQSVLAMSFPVSIGTFLVYGISSLCSALNSFKWTFYIASFVTIFIAIVWLLVFDKLVFKCRIEKIDTEGEDPIAKVDLKREKKKVKIDKSFYVLFCVLALFAMVNNFVKDGLNTWTPTILKDMFSLDNWISVLLTIALPIFAVIGAALSIFLNRKIHNYIIVCGLLYLATLIICLVLVFAWGLNSWLLTLVCFMSISFMMACINSTLTNVFPLQCKGGVNAGMVAGLIDGFCYLGSALSSYGLGKIIDSLNNDWKTVIVLFAILCAVCVFIVVVTTSISAISKAKRQKV